MARRKIEANVIPDTPAERARACQRRFFLSVEVADDCRLVCRSLAGITPVGGRLWKSKSEEAPDEQTVFADRQTADQRADDWNLYILKHWKQAGGSRGVVDSIAMEDSGE